MGADILFCNVPKMLNMNNVEMYSRRGSSLHYLREGSGRASSMDDSAGFYEISGSLLPVVTLHKIGRNITKL